MIIRTKAKLKDGIVNLVYKDCNNFGLLPVEKCTQAYGICFYKGKIVIAKSKRGHWGLIGGTIEPGETPEEALIREIKEESNMKVNSYKPIGYQHIVETDIYQLRYACSVIPYGKFEKDPAGEIISILLVDPKKFNTYINWGIIGKRLLNQATLFDKLLPSR